MREDLTEIAVVLDRSGSMESIRTDAMGGFNAFLASQKKEPGELLLTLVLFNHRVKTICARVPVAEVPPLDETTYVPAGMTALLDAVGRTVDELGERLAATPEDERPGQVVVAILTDGLENSSRDYTPAQIRDRIGRQSKDYGWEFLFLAAGQDAVLEGGKLDIPAANAIAFDASPEGIREASLRLDDETTSRRRKKKKKMVN